MQTSPTKTIAPHPTLQKLAGQPLRKRKGFASKCDWCCENHHPINFVETLGFSAHVRHADN